MYSKFLSQMTGLFVVLVALSNPVFAKHVETASYDDVYGEVVSQVQAYGMDRVLVVFDIDNTLLANKQDFGTDQWFEWQYDMIKAKKFDHAVARDLAGLVAVQNMIYSVSGMREVQPEVSDVVRDIQSAQIASIVLTARNLDSRDATIRELLANEISFKNSAIGPRGGIASSFVPYSLDNLSAAGLSAAELAAWNLAAARDVSYVDGVYMTGGQHKGAMLRALLARLNRSFDAIVFVDDKASNIKAMQQAYLDGPVDLTTIRYTREDAQVSRFKNDDKAAVIQNWKVFSGTLRELFGFGK